MLLNSSYKRKVYKDKNYLVIMAGKNNVKKILSRLSTVVLLLGAGLFALNSYFKTSKLELLPNSGIFNKLEERISKETEKPNQNQDKYAVLISGKTEISTQADLSLAYQVLLENDFPKRNIYILDRKGGQQFFYPVDGSAEKQEIKNLFSHLGKIVDDQDLLFVYLTDHGKRKKSSSGDSVSTFTLLGQYFDQREFSEYIKGINPRIGILLFDQCYSGGFAEECGKGKFIGIASTKKTSKGTNQIYRSMGGLFMYAFRDEENSDSNKDGKVSLQEAIAYMSARHRAVRSGRLTPVIQGEYDLTKVFLDNSKN